MKKQVELTLDDVREALVELIGDECKQSRIVISQMCDLWERWQLFKDETQPQKFYLGMACLKQFNSIYLRIDPAARKPGASDPMAKLLTAKRERTLAKTDPLAKYLR